MEANAIDVKNAPIESSQNISLKSDTAELISEKQKASDKNSSMNNGKISAEETQEIVDSLEGYMDVLQTNIAFSLNDKTDKVVVTIINKETNEVIRQIPPEELVALQEKMKELTGLIFSETV